MFVFACLCVLPVICWVLGLVMRVLGWTFRAVFSILGVLLFPILLLCGLLPVALFFLVPAGVLWLAYSAFIAD